MNNSIKAHGMLFTTALIGGLNFTISKLLMPEYATPLAIVTSRGIITILFFGLIHYFFIKEKIQKKDYGRISLVSLLGVVINQLSFYEGLNLTKPINASLVMTITPLFVLLLSLSLKKEKFTILKLIGIIIGMIGSILLLLNSGSKNLTGFLNGDLLILINAICWASYLVLVKPLALKYHPITILLWMFSIGILFIFPIGYQDFMKTQWGQFTTTTWLAFGFVVLFATVISYTFNTFVLKYVNPSTAGSYTYLQPIIASIIAIAWGVDNFSIEKMSYLILILSGVYIISYKKN